MSPQTMRRSNAYDHLTCRELQLYGGDSTHTHTHCKRKHQIEFFRSLRLMTSNRASKGPFVSRRDFSSCCVFSSHLYQTAGEREKAQTHLSSSKKKKKRNGYFKNVKKKRITLKTIYFRERSCAHVMVSLIPKPKFDFVLSTLYL